MPFSYLNRGNRHGREGRAGGGRPARGRYPDFHDVGRVYLMPIIVYFSRISEHVTPKCFLNIL